MKMLDTKLEIQSYSFRMVQVFDHCTLKSSRIQTQSRSEVQKEVLDMICPQLKRFSFQRRGRSLLKLAFQLQSLMIVMVEKPLIWD